MQLPFKNGGKVLKTIVEKVEMVESILLGPIAIKRRTEAIKEQQTLINTRFADCHFKKVIVRE